MCTNRRFSTHNQYTHTHFISFCVSFRMMCVLFVANGVWVWRTTFLRVLQVRAPSWFVIFGNWIAILFRSFPFTLLMSKYIHNIFRLDAWRDDLSFLFFKQQHLLSVCICIAYVQDTLSQFFFLFIYSFIPWVLIITNTLFLPLTTCGSLHHTKTMSKMQ